MEPAPAQPAATQADTLPVSQKVVGMLSLATCLALTALDMTMVSTALPTIATELKSPQLAPWVGTANLLTSTSIAPLWGRLGDVFGRKNLLLLNIVVFMLGSLLCALAPTMIVLIVGRGVQGLGGGGLMSLVFVIISDLVTLRERGQYQAIMSGIVGGCAIIGPLIGGLITDLWNWRGIFWICVPLSCAAFVGAFFFLPVPPPKDSSLRAMLRRVDYGGAVLCIVAITLFLLGLTFSTQYGWGSVQCLAPLLIGAALGAAFVLYEIKVPAEPNVPMRLFKARNYTVVVSCMFLLGWSMQGVSFYAPQFLQNAQGSSASQAGIQTIPYLGTFIPVSLACGIASSRLGIYTPFPKAGLAVATAGLGLMSTLAASTPYAQVAGYLVLMGVGFGMSNSMLMLSLQANCDLHDIGPGTTVGTFMRTIGATMGIGIGGTVLTAGMQARLVPSFVADLAAKTGASQAQISAVVQEIVAKLPGNATSPVYQEAKAAVSGAYGAAYATVFLSYAPVAGVCWIVVLFLKHVPLRGKKGGKAAAQDAEKGQTVEVPQAAEEEGKDAK
ncbi:major facilitator superfamily domain-containing protein [Hyaloraphidium curvatum]|nr:major facilitator superfamily domain-containing protein [Hyaloraphidium curvatum]